MEKKIILSLAVKEDGMTKEYLIDPFKSLLQYFLNATDLLELSEEWVVGDQARTLIEKLEKELELQPYLTCWVVRRLRRHWKSVRIIELSWVEKPPKVRRFTYDETIVEVSIPFDDPVNIYARFAITLNIEESVFRSLIKGIKARQRQGESIEKILSEL